MLWRRRLLLLLLLMVLLLLLTPWLCNHHSATTAAGALVHARPLQLALAAKLLRQPGLLRRQARLLPRRLRGLLLALPLLRRCTHATAHTHSR